MQYRIVIQHKYDWKLDTVCAKSRYQFKAFFQICSGLDRLIAGLLDHRSVRNRIGKRNTDLDDIRSCFLLRFDDCRSRFHIRKSCCQIGDKCLFFFCLQRSQTFFYTVHVTRSSYSPLV